MRGYAALVSGTCGAGGAPWPRDRARLRAAPPHAATCEDCVDVEHDEGPGQVRPLGLSGHERPHQRHVPVNVRVLHDAKPRSNSGADVLADLELFFIAGGRPFKPPRRGQNPQAHEPESDPQRLQLAVRADQYLLYEFVPAPFQISQGVRIRSAVTASTTRSRLTRPGRSTASTSLSTNLRFRWEYQPGNSNEEPNRIVFADTETLWAGPGPASGNSGS